MVWIWTRFLNLRDFLDSRDILGQAVIVTQKPGVSNNLKIQLDLEKSRSFIQRIQGDLDYS